MSYLSISFTILTKRQLNLFENGVYISRRIFVTNNDKFSTSNNQTQSYSIGNIVSEGSIRLKVRQHVNPLSSKYQVPINLPSNWIQQVYSISNNSFLIDIGCAKGTFGLNFARQNPNINVLGLEIRQPVVDLCMKRKRTHKIENIHFLNVNVNIDLERLLKEINTSEGINSTENSNKIDFITIQFPDPHFKSKHKKRRVVNDELVEIIAKQTQFNTNIFVQSDIEELANDMTEHFIRSKYFQPKEGYDPSDLINNKSPFLDLPTEREIATFNKGLPVFRMMFYRNKLNYEISSAFVTADRKTTFTTNDNYNIDGVV
eukprot:gene5719-7894_t